MVGEVCLLFKFYNFNAYYYLINMNRTADVSSNQCIFVLSYIKDKTEDNKSTIEVTKWVIALKTIILALEQSLFNLSKLKLNSINICFDKCITEIFDSVINTNGQYQNIQTKPISDPKDVSLRDLQ